MRLFEFTLDNSFVLTVKPPTIRRYHALHNAANDEELIHAIAEVVESDDDFVMDNFTTDDTGRFLTEYTAWISQTKQSNPN